METKMSSEIRNAFNDVVFKRDGGKCCICHDTNNVVVHHILDRHLFSPLEESYNIDNGIALCPECHIKAENGFYTCEQLRQYAKIIKIFLPKTFDSFLNYDKFGNILEDILIRYPRTKHISGSGISKDDSPETVSWSDLFQKHLIIEEKSDGANTGISFNDSCEMLLQCRGHFLKGGRDWPEFDQFKVWTNTWKDQLFDILTNRYIMYGEWMYAFHSVFYDNLPHYFLEFDIYDKKNKYFLSTDKRHEILDRLEIPIHSVYVLKEGVFNNKEDILSCIGISKFASENSYKVLEKSLKDKNIPEEDIKIILKLNIDRFMEGLYIKWEEDGIVKDRYKFVRPIFVKTILEYGKHWLDRPTIQNILSPTANMFTMKG